MIVSNSAPRRHARAPMALLVLSISASCGGSAPAGTGVDRTPSPAPVGEDQGEGSHLAAPLAGLPPLAAPRPGGSFRVVEPRPALADPRGAVAVRARAQLVGRSDGRASVDFPLVHTRVSARVAGNLARVEVVQRWENPSDQRLEATYAFPLPEDAAVTDMTFQIGRRVVQGEIRRRDDARAAFESARREGRSAALTEQERPNLFTQSLANVPPRETVFVVLRYVQQVPFRDGRYTFVFPTTVGPRYEPGAPSSSSPSSSSSPYSSPSPYSSSSPSPSSNTTTPSAFAASGAHALDLLLRLEPGDAFDDVAARSHRLVTGLDGSGARLVGLDEGEGVPDRDVVVSWRPAALEPEARALVEREAGEDWLLLFAQPPAQVPAAMVRPREVVFLLDKSGSMMGHPIDIAKAVIGRALHALGPDDTFQIVAFDGSATAMTPAPLPGSAANVALAETWLAGLRGGGGTEMLAGIRATLRASSDPSRLRLLVFLTDGFIGNEPEVIEAVARERGATRVFGFGIGSSVNRYLVEGVARAGRGAAEVVGPRDDADAAVARMFARLDRPVLTDLEVSFQGGRVEDLVPGSLPDLFAGQPLTVAGRLRGPAPSAVVLRGRLGGAPWSRRVAIASAGTAPGAGPVAGTLWARRSVEELLHRRPTSPTPAEVEAATALGLRFHLVTPYTSFVAVERELLADPRLALASAVAPNLLPEGVSPEGIFGPATIQVLPKRVKPGDPELWIAAAPTARWVAVKLPFEESPRAAVKDGKGWALRFLVPPTVKDGSYRAEVTILHADGREELRTAEIRVDTSAAAVAVLSAPSSVEPGGRIELRMKAALPLGRVPALAGRPGGLAAALKSEMELKDVLVRAPWGEVATARQEGALGLWVATLDVPADAAPGPAALEIAASDGAGNVTRRTLEVKVAAGAGSIAFPPLPAILAGVLLLDVAVLGMALLLVRGGTWRMRGPAPLPAPAARPHPSPREAGRGPG
jgi:Ca-activated chloride channel family protein